MGRDLFSPEQKDDILEKCEGASPDRLEVIDLKAGESYHVRPGTVHRMTALTDCDVLEASTPHLSDVIRIDDRYGRAPAGE